MNTEPWKICVLHMIAFFFYPILLAKYTIAELLLSCIFHNKKHCFTERFSMYIFTVQYPGN
jgi:hypothetical protein